jgi:uncharacterized protein YbaP (TraB family)
MKNYLKIAVAVVLISSGVFAQAKGVSVSSNEKSLLWEISGKGLSKTSYLYGTIHMICAMIIFYLRKLKSF